MASDDQLDAREGQAGRLGVAERFVVPLKPGNAGGGRDLSSRQTHYVVKDMEIGQPINSEKCSETADGVARKKQMREVLSERSYGAGGLGRGTFIVPTN